MRDAVLNMLPAAMPTPMPAAFLAGVAVAELEARLPRLPSSEMSACEGSKTGHRWSHLVTTGNKVDTHEMTFIPIEFVSLHFQFTIGLMPRFDGSISHQTEASNGPKFKDQDKDKDQEYK